MNLEFIFFALESLREMSAEPGLDITALLQRAKSTPGTHASVPTAYVTMPLEQRRELVRQMRELRNEHTMIWIITGCTSTSCEEGDSPACGICPELCALHHDDPSLVQTSLDDFHDVRFLDGLVSPFSIVASFLRINVLELLETSFVVVVLMCMSMYARVIMVILLMIMMVMIMSEPNLPIIAFMRGKFYRRWTASLLKKHGIEN